MTDYNNQIRTAGSTLFNTEVSEVVGRHSLQQTSGDQQEQTPGNQQYPEPTKFGKHKALKRMGGMDVILGRGRSYHNLPGNQRFRDIITLYRDKYLISSPNDKQRIKDEILDIVLASGRFVKFNEESDSFDPVPREQAALKVCHAIQYQLRREDKAMMECENRKKAKIGLYLPTKTNPMKNVMSMQQESFVSAQATSSGYSEQNAALRVDVAGAASGCERDRKCLREQVAGPAQVRHLPTIDENDFSSLTYAMLLHHVYDCPTQLGELPQPLIGGSPTVPLPLPPADPDAAIFASLLKHQIQQMETEKIKTVAALTARDAAYFSSFLEHKNQQVEAERMEKNATLRLRDAAYFASLLEQQNQQREAVQSGANAALHDIDAHNHDELPPPLVGRPAGHDELPLSSETTAYSKLGDNHANSIDDLIAAALDFVFGKR